MDRFPVPANDGRRYAAVPHATDRFARVRINVTSPQGKHLPTVSASLSAEGARSLGLALIEAAVRAEAERDALAAGAA